MTGFIRVKSAPMAVWRQVMPRYAVFFMFMMLASVGLPGTSGFVGEMLVLVGAWHASSWVAFFTATGLVLGATYMLWLYRRVMFGAIVNEQVKAMEPMQMREFSIFLPLTFLVLLVRGLSDGTSRCDGRVDPVCAGWSVGKWFVITGSKLRVSEDIK
jgi:NADH:ubiquinone oxidoreductase subunit 4 (subunit M)